MAIATGSRGPTGNLQRVSHPEPPRSLRRGVSGTSTAHARTDTADEHRVDGVLSTDSNNRTPFTRAKDRRSTRSWRTKVVRNRR